MKWLSELDVPQVGANQETENEFSHQKCIWGNIQNFPLTSVLPQHPSFAETTLFTVPAKVSSTAPGYRSENRGGHWPKAGQRLSKWPSTKGSAH